MVFDWAFCSVEHAAFVFELPLRPETFLPLAHPQSGNRVFHRLNCIGLGEEMKGITEKSSFSKTAHCPSSSTLLSFRLQQLSPEIGALIRFHLASCEFCGAELSLLAHHSRLLKGDDKVPELPMNLRILAESILCRNKVLVG